jgi:hypothetical protein
MVAGGVALGLLVLAGCSGDDGATGSSAATTTPATTIPAATITATTLPATTIAVATSPVTLPAVPPEPTGVPGLDAVDPLCAGWATYAGTVQLLAVGAAFGEQTEGELAAAEMYAAPAVVAALDGVAGAWPAALESERTVVLDEVLGPMRRRAQKAVDALRAAGLSDEDLGTLAAAWTTVLTTRDPDDPRVTRPTAGVDLDARVDLAASAFLAAVPSLDDDPSLLVATVEYPATQAHLASACPDLAASGVGDAI